MKREELETLDKDELIEIILALVNRGAELETRLGMNSTNSSRSPSSDAWKKPQSSRKKSGKSLADNRDTRGMSQNKTLN